MKKLLILFSIMIMTAVASSSFSVCQKHLIEKHKTEVLHPHLQMPEYIMSDKELEYLDEFLEGSLMQKMSDLTFCKSKVRLTSIK